MIHSFEPGTANLCRPGTSELPRGPSCPGAVVVHVHPLLNRYESMEYEVWREDLFGQSPNIDPGNVELLQETYDLPTAPAFDYIDRALRDDEIHDLYSKAQIGTGLQLIYCNHWSDLPFCYIEGTTEARRIEGISNLRRLYDNYFERYCPAPVKSVGNDRTDGGFGFLCYMFWDIFVLYPGNATPAMIEAAVEVMAAAIRSDSEQCIVSAIHGLGHWAMDTPVARNTLRDWLRSPSTKNPTIIDYAGRAVPGCIL